MTLRPLDVSFRIPWTAHDAWSEAYIGVRRLVYEVLPARIADQEAEDSALCQLALVGSSHLVELALDGLLKSFAEAGTGGLTPISLRKASQERMLTHWLPTVSGRPLNEQAPPIASIQALRQRRNATVHRESALATVVLARSALFSAIEGCRYVFAHADRPFPWEDSVREYSLPKEAWFADLVMPSNAGNLDK